MDIIIRHALPSDLGSLSLIEHQADSLFHDVPEYAHLATTNSTMPSALLSSLCAANTLWVAVPTSSPTTPVAFLAGESLDKYFHIMQVSVAQLFQRRKLGTRLIQAAEDYAQRNDFDGLSLATDKEILWNGPAYARMGFQETEAKKLGASHLRKLKLEEDAGLPVSRRCMMMKAFERSQGVAECRA